MKKKKTLTCWIPKSFTSLNNIKRKDGNIEMYHTKGCKSDWTPRDWPPIKIKVTMEIIDATK